MDLCLLVRSPSVWTFPFRRPSWQYLRKPLSLFPRGIHVHRGSEKKTTGFWPATILTRLFEMTPTVSIFQAISSFLYAPQVSPGHRELKAPYLPSLPVDKAFFFPPHQQPDSALELRRQQLEVFLVLALWGGKGYDTISHLWHSTASACKPDGKKV